MWHYANAVATRRPHLPQSACGGVGLIFALGLGKYFTFGEVDRSAPTLGAAEA